MNARLTIGVTCYNDEAYIGECLRSVISQTPSDVEVIVIDDASTDQTPAIVAGVAGKDGGRIRVVRHDRNSGSPTAGRAEVIEMSRGDYVHFIDADDILEPNFASEVLLAASRDPSLDWIAPSVRIIDGEGTLGQVWDYSRLGFSSNVPQALMRGYQTASVAVPMKSVFRLSFLRSSGLSYYELPGTPLGEDAFTCVRYLEYNPRISILSEPLIRYRLHGGNVSAGAVNRARMVVELKDYYIQHFSEMLYMPHLGFLRLEHGSHEYLAFKFFLVASDFARAKREFKVPEIYVGSGPQALEEPRAVFDAAIARYARRSLEHGDFHAAELEPLLEQTGSADAG